MATEPRARRRGAGRPPVEVAVLVRKPPLGSRLVARVRAAVAAAAWVQGRPAPRLSVAVVGDRRMRRLNRDYHGADETTDVLAFPLEDGADGPEGEVIVCAPEARRQARYRGLDPALELLLYVVHGTLHLLGEDDGTPAEARRMRSQEARAIRRLGLSLPDSHLRELKVP